MRIDQWDGETIRLSDLQTLRATPAQRPSVKFQLASIIPQNARSIQSSHRFGVELCHRSSWVATACLVMPMLVNPCFQWIYWVQWESVLDYLGTYWAYHVRIFDFVFWLTVEELESLRLHATRSSRELLRSWTMIFARTSMMRQTHQCPKCVQFFVTSTGLVLCILNLAAYVHSFSPLLLMM